MNHSTHWKESPVFIARPNDDRLERILVFRLKDPRRINLAWTVANQRRNSTLTNWRTIEVFHFDLYCQALAFARLLLKAA